MKLFYDVKQYVVYGSIVLSGGSNSIVAVVLCSSSSIVVVVVVGRSIRAARVAGWFSLTLSLSLSLYPIWYHKVLLEVLTTIHIKITSYSIYCILHRSIVASTTPVVSQVKTIAVGLIDTSEEFIQTNERVYITIEVFYFFFNIILKVSCQYLDLVHLLS